MNLCKEILPDGTLCPNQPDEGQEYCPFHLASQDADLKKTLFKSLKHPQTVIAIIGLYKFAKQNIGIITKIVTKIKG